MEGGRRSKFSGNSALSVAQAQPQRAHFAVPRVTSRISEDSFWNSIFRNFCSAAIPPTKSPAQVYTALIYPIPGKAPRAQSKCVFY